MPGAAARSGDPVHAVENQCDDIPALGADTNDTNAIPLLGNRVDRFLWDGSTLRFDRNIIKMRASQSDGGPEPNQGDEGQPPRGNHDCGVLAFGPDGKLHIFVGDLGRRGQLQNLRFGPTGAGSRPPLHATRRALQRP